MRIPRLGIGSVVCLGVLAAGLTLGCTESAAAPLGSDGPHLREAPSLAPGQPRPSTQGSVSCEGASIDPPQLPLVLSEPAETSARVRALEALAGAHPSSATTRTRLGEQLLRTQPPSEERASRWFDRALALHEEGCTLAERDHWATLEGAALSRMMQGDYTSALPLLTRSLARWPAARATRYNLACARCQTGDVDACADALARVLDGGPDTEPAFLEGELRSRDHYVRMAEGDPDLAPLRADAARFSSLLR